MTVVLTVLVLFCLLVYQVRIVKERVASVSLVMSIIGRHYGRPHPWHTIFCQIEGR